MLATLADAPLRDPRFVYEPKYDGIRALVEVAGGVSGEGPAAVRIWSRLGNEKSSQFPEIVSALGAWAARRGRGGRAARPPVLVLDGEIVAVDAQGTPLGFQRLQDRIHLNADGGPGRLAAKHRAVLIVFDLLREGAEDLRGLPLVQRRMRLEAALGGKGAGDLPDAVRLSQIVVGDGTALYQQALAEGWEGLVVKDAASIYRSGQRSLDWRKLKLVQRQEMVVGGWTEPRRSRAAFGALLLGQWDAGGLRYVGHVGSGFTERDLHRIGALLAARATAERPFSTLPPANERPHWARPELVAEVQYSGWTDDGIIRHAVFLGLRDDVPAASVRRQEEQKPAPGAPEPAAATAPTGPQLRKLRERLEAIEASGPSGSGTLALPGGGSLEITNLNKKLWPKLGLTKGDLFRYYVAVAPQILPVLRDRPLVMRRFPNGIDQPAFYQQRAPDEVPAGVNVRALPADREVPARLVGGSLLTLLYTAQLAAISQDPWFSRVTSPDDLDFAAVDLDPGPGASFARVLDVARWTRDELCAAGVPAFAKTSGASGLHIYIPMRPGTPYDAGLLFCQIIATLVAAAHPSHATVERIVDRRRPDAVYVDYLQNIRGKTIASAYSARASDFAGASAPIGWDEVAAGVDPRDFTIPTLPERIRASGDLWAKLRRSRGADLEAALERVRGKHARA